MNKSQAATIRVLDVDYTHLELDNGADLYVTECGKPFLEFLRPENYLTDREWFNRNAVPLSGTSAVYRVPTKPIGGVSKDLVVKWNRMGQDIPGAERLDHLDNAEFNSPFEEFSLVLELRNAHREPPGWILLQKPLAIYAAAEHVELSRSGRREYRMHAKLQSHPEIPLNMFRMYAVIYEWVKGIDAIEAFEEGLLDERLVESLTMDSRIALSRKGFVVRDSKPQHLIVRPRPDNTLAMNRSGMPLYALVDFELLERTPQREAFARRTKRKSYLERQRDRFLPRDPASYPPHLKRMKILGIPYVYGHTESTDGALWVVGNDPNLFDYFLPERWKKQPQTRLSQYHEIYHTLTRDNLNIVWEVSNVGLQPDADPFMEDERKILEHGYNSPFEEFALAIKLARCGVPTVYPRAIYMTGSRAEHPGPLDDMRRHTLHRKILTPEGDPILREDRNYVMLWGYWSGPDEKLAARDQEYYEAVDALRALKEGILTKEAYLALMQRVSDRLMALGVEDLNLRGNHILLSIDSSGKMVRDAQGEPEARICNFELLRRVKRPAFEANVPRQA